MKIYNLIYTDQDLTQNLQSFDADHALIKAGRYKNTLIRLAMVTMLATQSLLVAVSWHPYRLVMFFTNWCLLATLFSIFLSLVCSLDTAIADKKGLLAAHQFLFQISCPMNLLCVSVYWSLLHQESITDEEVLGNPVREFLMYANHITPFVFNWINFSITDVVMAKSHWKGL